MKPTIIPKSFYFIRHGQSTWNVTGKFAGGQTDIPLTDIGIQQAQTAATIINTIAATDTGHYARPYTRIVHSTLQRARQTADIINQLNKPMTADFNLREIDGGEWTGLDNHIAVKNWADGLTPENGESLDVFAVRIADAFNRALQTDEAFDNDLPLIVAHGRILNGLDHLYDIAPRTLQTANCEILLFEPKTDGHYPWTVTRLTNENGHIHGEVADWSMI